MTDAARHARFHGCLLGLAVGDALGTTLEFCAPGSFTPIDDIHGGGPFALRAGQWTDDTAMALCLAHSLLHRQGFDAADQMNRDCNWYQHGYLSSTGACFDIGATVRQALERYLDGGPAFGGGTDPRSAGNGSLMRLAPVAMYDAQCPDQLADRAADSSRTTHAAAEALDACRLFAVQLRAALLGGTRDQVLHAQPETSLTPAVHALAIRDHVAVPAAQIRGTGYVIDSLSAALWCFATTEELCRGRAACRQPGRRCGHHHSDLRAARRRVLRHRRHPGRLARTRAGCGRDCCAGRPVVRGGVSGLRPQPRFNGPARVQHAVGEAPAACLRPLMAGRPDHA